MLYFTESAWTLPDIMDVAKKFDDEYDQSEYERKIARIIAKAARQVRDEGQFDRWQDAIQVLEREDHYLGVMIRYAHIRPPHDRLKLWASGFAVVGAFASMALLASFVSDRYHVDFGKYFPSRSDFRLYFWGSLVSIFILNLLANVILGARYVNFVSNLFGRLYRSRNKSEK
jgi:hypothetical protein